VSRLAVEDSEDVELELGDETMEDDLEENTQPIDFETFIPMHNPSLEHTVDRGTLLPSQSSVPRFAAISRDHAFQQATQAWYWAGYWTAIYHVSFISLEQELLLLEFSQSKLEETDSNFTSLDLSHGTQQTTEPEVTGDDTQGEVMDGMLPAQRE
jgi:hypothetical protein